MLDAKKAIDRIVVMQMKHLLAVSESIHRSVLAQINSPHVSMEHHSLKSPRQTNVFYRAKKPKRRRRSWYLNTYCGRMLEARNRKNVCVESNPTIFYEEINSESSA